MIWTLNVECVSGMYFRERCVRTIQIEEYTCLYVLHDAIQNSVDFERDHPFIFFLSNSSSPWAHKKFITEKDSWDDIENDLRRISLKHVLPRGRKKLYYMFDFGDKWIFEIRKKRGSQEPDNRITYPQLIDSIGPNPEQ